MTGELCEVCRAPATVVVASRRASNGRWWLSGPLCDEHAASYGNGSVVEADRRDLLPI